MTQIAFENSTALRIPSHGTKGTGRDAHLATDTPIMIDANAIQFFVVENGFSRANRHAGRIFALLTAHGDIRAGGIPFDNVNTRQRRTANAVVPNRTNQFTVPATGAFFRIDNHYFLVHRLSLTSISAMRTRTSRSQQKKNQTRKHERAKTRKVKI